MKKILILLIITNLFAVGEAGAIFLLISPSATANGVGGSGVSNTTSDVYSSFFNPAHSYLPDGFSIETSNINVPWLTNLADDISFSSRVIKLNYNGYYITDNLYLNFSLSESDLDVNLENQNAIGEWGNFTGEFISSAISELTTFSIGIQSKKYPFLFSIGRTNKTAVQTLVPSSVNVEGISGSSTDKFHDWGFRFIMNNYNIDNLDLMFSLGYSQSNIGSPISFIDGQEGDPAPKTARLGLTLGANIKYFKNTGIGLKFIREAEDLMINKEGLVGDIDFFNHILSGNSNMEVIIHNGIEINIFDIYYSRKGKFIDEGGDINISTKGYGINYSKLFLFPTLFADISKYRFFNIFKRIDVQRNYSEYNAEIGHPLDNITFDETTVSINYKF